MKKQTIKMGVICLASLFACKQPIPKDLNNDTLIPLPSEVIATGSSFEINPKTTIVVSQEGQELETLAAQLQTYLFESTGLKLEISTEKSSNAIVLGISSNIEGYHIEVVEDNILLNASAKQGLFYAMQTLRQLLPVKATAGEPILIASGEINDAPYYNYRGSMLDVSRHFFTVEQVKRYIDHLAMLKMNILHLHLSDDQGWRIEIKSWPNLTTHGGATQVGGDKGGFYTQEQYKELVKYAGDRFITIIPEIDLPGHTNAALSSYAELNADGKATEPYTGTEVGFSTLDARKEITYKFVDDVIKEVAAMTPGEYIHIGGDESHSTKKEDYIYFINKVQDIVKKHNKTMIGWADVVAADVDEDCIAQYWQGEPKNAIIAKKKNLKIIMSTLR